MLGGPLERVREIPMLLIGICNSHLSPDVTEFWRSTTLRL